MNTVERRPMTPWVKWLGIGTYVLMAVVLVSAGTSDPQALLMGAGMIAFGIACWYLGGQRIGQATERVTELLGEGLAWLLIATVQAAVPLLALYFLVRFVKWAWTD